LIKRGKEGRHAVHQAAAYHLARIMAHLRETVCCIIGVALLLLNPTMPLRMTLCFFGLLFDAVVLLELRTRALYMKAPPIVSIRRSFHA